MHCNTYTKHTTPGMLFAQDTVANATRISRPSKTIRPEIAAVESKMHRISPISSSTLHLGQYQHHHQHHRHQRPRGLSQIRLSLTHSPPPSSRTAVMRMLTDTLKNSCGCSVLKNLIRLTRCEDKESAGRRVEDQRKGQRQRKATNAVRTAER